MLSPEKYSNPKDLTYYLSCTTSQTTELWTCKGHIADLYWCKRNVCLHSSRSGYLRQAFYYPKITKLLSLQRCVACEVRVNLNYSTEVHFTLLYWFKSRTWQCKSNRACVKVTWKPGKQQTWRLILRWSAFRTTFTRTMKLCNLLLKWLLGSNLSHIVHFVHPNRKC